MFLRAYRRGLAAAAARCAGRLAVIAGLLLASVATTSALADAPKLAVEGDSGAGHLRLSWDLDAPAQSELQMADNPAFDGALVRYRGDHTASVLSGLRDGERYFRVRTHRDGQSSDWSNVVSFTIEHHERGFALLLLLAGALVFATTLGFLISFSRRHQHD